MGKKIFVTYKYGDTKVHHLGGREQTRARHYVDVLQSLLDVTDHINKGEKDGESLSDFKDSTIASKLRDKIYDSSITIVIISKGMKDSIAEVDQWIPWEVSYSLKEHSRSDRVSRTNAVLAVILPDENGSYAYYVTDNACPHCKCRSLNTPFLFGILKSNMFNIKNPEYVTCPDHVNSGKVYKDYASYIYSVKWCDFSRNLNHYIGLAEKINERITEYEITKDLK